MIFVTTKWLARYQVQASCLTAQARCTQLFRQWWAITDKSLNIVRQESLYRSYKKTMFKETTTYLYHIFWLTQKDTTVTLNSEGDFFSIFANDNCINTERKVNLTSSHILRSTCKLCVTYRRCSLGQVYLLEEVGAAVHWDFLQLRLYAFTVVLLLPLRCMTSCSWKPEFYKVEQE